MAKTLSDIVQVDDTTPRDVTETNPLVIDDVSVRYAWVRIIDGDIISRVETSVVFDKLEKAAAPSKAKEKRS